MAYQIQGNCKSYDYVLILLAEWVKYIPYNQFGNCPLGCSKQTKENDQVSGWVWIGWQADKKQATDTIKISWLMVT